MSNSLSYGLGQGEHEYNEETFEIPVIGEYIKSSTFKSFSSERLSLKFNKCIFRGGFLEFENISQPNIEVKFNDCIFDCEFVIKDSSFFSLGFLNTKQIKSISISSGTFNHLSFKNSSENHAICGNVRVTDCKIINTLSFENLNHQEGEFLISVNENEK
ncbi:MAG: hypothetical protein EOO43_18445 [Flavobacterium sp.]|nr:MAG: hypothetical protein EOO43_18445 [Flavobacterium sp.]